MPRASYILRALLIYRDCAVVPFGRVWNERVNRLYAVHGSSEVEYHSDNSKGYLGVLYGHGVSRETWGWEVGEVGASPTVVGLIRWLLPCMPHDQCRTNTPCHLWLKLFPGPTLTD